MFRSILPYVVPLLHHGEQDASCQCQKETAQLILPT